MRISVSATLEAGRIISGPYASGYGELHGAFVLRGPKGSNLRVISSGIDSEYGWEHVSVSRHNKTPSWDEMCFVKDLFWGEDEVVIQYHPAKDDYVNHHPYCLHLWRPIDGKFPTPPSLLVGPKTEGVK